MSKLKTVSAIKLYESSGSREYSFDREGISRSTAVFKCCLRLASTVSTSKSESETIISAELRVPGEAV